MLLGIIIIIFIIVFMARNWKMIKYYEPLRFFEKISLVKNQLSIQTSQVINKDSLSLYFVKFIESKPIRYDTITLYEYGKIINSIPDEYGKNHFILRYKDVIYDKIGFFKIKEWYKYNYQINIHTVNDIVIIDWSISNKYEIISGSDTMSLPNTALQ